LVLPVEPMMPAAIYSAACGRRTARTTSALEQGRDRHPSDQVLLAIARALQLDEDATAYLLQLARPPRPRSKRACRPEKVSDGIRTLISSWPLTPAYVHGTYMGILAANTLATAASQPVAGCAGVAVLCRQGDRGAVGGLTDRRPLVRRCWGHPVDTGDRTAGNG
jgi:hypothetical protein